MAFVFGKTYISLPNFHRIIHTFWYIKKPEMTARYGRPFDWQSFMSEVLYIHQTFTDCVSNTYILISQYARCNYKLRKVLWFDGILWKFQCMIRNSSSSFREFCGKLVTIISTCHPAVFNFMYVMMFLEHKSKPM